MEGHSAPPPAEHGVRSGPPAPPPSAKTRSHAPEREHGTRASSRAEKPARSSRDADSGPVSVPVVVAPPEPTSSESDIRRLTRIIFSDIVIYGPEKADKAILQGRFEESYKREIEEGRKIIRSRFSSDTTAALETFKRCLDEILEARKKEINASVAL